HISLTQQFVAPNTAVEIELAQLWTEALRLEHVGVHDNFFDLGGHSLLAAKVLSKIKEVFNIDLPLRVLFERPTISLLARSIEAETRPGQASLIVPVERR